MKTRLHKAFAIGVVILLLLAGTVRPGAASPTLVPFDSTVQKVFAAQGFLRDGFGISVAVSGDTAIAGAYAYLGLGAQGSAYVYTRNGATWEFQQKLVASDGAKNDGFGVSVALSGDWALVGSLWGKAYVFVRNPGGYWTQFNELSAPDKNASFGSSVALSGKTALVGAYMSQVGVNTFQGAAYIFTLDEVFGQWMLKQTLTAPDGEALDSFGYSVALQGDTALVGSYNDKVGENSKQGSAYVFTRSGEVWTEQAKFTASDGAVNDTFGAAVALSGDTALVGVPAAKVGSTLLQGAAYVFTRSGETWNQEAKLTASDGKIVDNFGNAVAIQGNNAIVGAGHADVGENLDQGLAYVFSRSGTTWAEQTQLSAPDGATNDNFGVSVALSADTVLVGAFGAAISGTVGQGAAYFFSGVVPFTMFLPVMMNPMP